MATDLQSGLDYAAHRWADAMTIERLLQERVFEPEIIAPMTGAYERARLALGLTSRSDAATTLLAQTVIAVVESGVRDAEGIFRHTMLALKKDGM